MDVVGLSAADFPEWEPELDRFFRAFEKTANGTVRAEHFKWDVLSGRAQCWVVCDEEIRACALTAVHRGTATSVTLLHVAGEGHREWQETLLDTLMAWAREMGADWFCATCRPGFEPVLKSRGLRRKRLAMEVDLNG